MTDKRTREQAREDARREQERLDRLRGKLPTHHTHVLWDGKGRAPDDES